MDSLLHGCICGGHQSMASVCLCQTQATSCTCLPSRASQGPPRLQGRQAGALELQVAVLEGQE